MVTFHPTFKRSTVGFLPMVCIRGANGKMIGSRIGRDEYSSASAALCHATNSAQLVARGLSDICKVA